MTTIRVQSDERDVGCMTARDVGLIASHLMLSCPLYFTFCFISWALRGPHSCKLLPALQSQALSTLYTL